MGVTEICICGAVMSIAALYKLCTDGSEAKDGYDVRALVMKLNREAELPPHKRYTKNN